MTTRSSVKNLARCEHHVGNIRFAFSAIEKANKTDALSFSVRKPGKPKVAIFSICQIMLLQQVEINTHGSKAPKGR